MRKETKILFWGTSNFAVRALAELKNTGYNLIGVVTSPDEPAGRKLVLTPSPAKIWAAKNNIPVYQPDNLSKKIELPKADLFIVAAYGKIIPEKLLEIPESGILNIHPSLLPRWRGPSPIQYTVLAGDKETGVTIIKLDKQMDHGPVIANSKRQIANSRITYKELHDELAKEGAKLLTRILPDYLAGKIKLIPQNDSEATYCKIITKQDGRINWSKPAEEIERIIRAFNAWPGGWTFWPYEGKNCRLRVDEADIIADMAPGKAFGYVWQNNPSSIMVQTGKGSLVIQKLTLEGKKTVSADEFLRGYPKIIGSILL